MTRIFTPGEIAVLTAKLEVATEPSREIDAEIHLILYPHIHKTSVGVAHCGCAPSYTASVDAALDLVPEGYFWCLASELDCAGATVTRSNDPLGEDIIAPTAPLALCIAALRARATIQEGDA